MESPFFRSNWNNFMPRPRNCSPSMREVPVQRQAKPPSPKVVSIPVQFVGSERSRFDSALKIQKAFRGFLVKKSVKKIAAIRGEVDEIERRISKKETVELLKRDAKERLKVNETLMSLLFRLDSVKGVDSGVRDFRRAVTKKAIALQERVDAAVADDQTLGGFGNVESISEHVHGELEVKDSGEGCEDGEKATNQTVGLQSVASESLDETPNLQSSEQTANSDLCEAAEEGVETESQSGSSSDKPEDSMEGAGETKLGKQEEDGMEFVKSENEGFGDRDKEENKKNRELLERMVEDNERMMGLMTELFQRNDMQTRLLSSLSQRVEQLERAFLCDRLRRRKMRRHAL